MIKYFQFELSWDSRIGITFTLHAKIIKWGKALLVPQWGEDNRNQKTLETMHRLCTCTKNRKINHFIWRSLQVTILHRINVSTYSNVSVSTPSAQCRGAILINLDIYCKREREKKRKQMRGSTKLPLSVWRCGLVLWGGGLEWTEVPQFSPGWWTRTHCSSNTSADTVPLKHPLKPALNLWTLHI